MPDSKSLSILKYLPSGLILLIFQFSPLIDAAQLKQDKNDQRSLYKILKKERKKLLNAGIIEVMSFERGAIGPLDSNISCPCRSGFVNSYLIWNDGVRYFIKKYDCCQIFQKKETEVDLFAYYRKNREIINHEKIKSRFYVIYYHFRHIHADIAGVKLDFQLNDCDFSNTNRLRFRENNKLLIKKWCDQIEQVVQTEEKKGFMPETIY